jgi:putative membrane protein
MFVWIARWVLNALALYIVSQIVPGIHVANFTAALIAVFVIGLVNTLVKPILFLLTLPITIVTLGLFTLILNALMLLLAGSMLSGFSVDGFGAAFIGSILLSVVSTLLQSFVK